MNKNTQQIVRSGKDDKEERTVKRFVNTLTVHLRVREL